MHFDTYDDYLDRVVGQDEEEYKEDNPKLVPL